MTDYDQDKQARRKKPASERILPRLLSTAGAAEYLNRSEWKIRQLVHSGELPVVRDGREGDFRFDVRDLDAYIERNKRQAV